jgi:TPR repeat protein
MMLLQSFCWLLVITREMEVATGGEGDGTIYLGDIYFEGGDLKKAKFHFEAAAMAGDDVARFNIGSIEFNSGNIEQALKHWTIGASAGHYYAMYNLLIAMKKGDISRELVNSTLEAYNNSCAKMRSEDRDAYIRTIIETI